ncbi:hypothetical protein CRUP_025003 [Coryphaenoides rupestris]|nr:hypothetical protein CRUP_025003 [Coryphaenoides rupestris]
MAVAATAETRGLELDGCNYFRQRLVLSTLSGKRVRIRNIRSRDDQPGLRDFEASFIRLLDKLDGCNYFRQRLVLSTLSGKRVRIRNIRSRDDQPGLRGTVLFYQPGLLLGGTVEHDCNPQRSLGYYLEALLMLAAFMKTPLKATLRGVTNDPQDPSVDLLKATSLPLLKQFGIDGDGLELKVVKRGMAPGGGGEVVFSCPTRRTLRPVQLTEPGKIKRIRGVASPGFGLVLVAETQKGFFLSAELSSTPQGQGESLLPEDLGRKCAHLLLDEIYRGGCIDSTNQSLALLFMTLGQQDVSKVLLGPLSPYTVQFLRHIRDFFQIMFKMEVKPPLEDERKGGDKVLMTCVGVGFSNISKVTK